MKAIELNIYVSPIKQTESLKYNLTSLFTVTF